MNNTFDEYSVIITKGFHKRHLISHLGTIFLTNKRLVFRPSTAQSFFRNPLFFFGFFFVYLAGIVFIYPDYLLEIASMILGITFLYLAYRMRDRKEVAINFSDITDVKKARFRTSDLSIQLAGGRRERFAIKQDCLLADEFFETTKRAVRGEFALPTSLILSTSTPNVPKYMVYDKYPGAIVRPQKNYLTPSMCCMCGAPAFGETITPKSLAAEQLKKTSSGWSPRTFLTMPFPVCKDCHRIHNRMRLTGLLGGLIGFFAGLIVLIGLFLAGAFFPLAELADFAGVPNSKLVLPLIIIFSPAVTAWGLTLNSRFVLRQVPKEKQPFFRTVGNNKGIRVLGYSNGTFAFGFLNREFATLFQKLNGGVAASVGTNAEETT